MNGSKGYRAPDAADPPVESLPILSLPTVQRMLPLVRRIVTDFLDNQRAYERLEPEEARLDRTKRTLNWPERQHRYDVKDQLNKAENAMQSAVEELNGLGVVLLDAELGRVGFPTMVNNRRAYFSWRHGEDGLHAWHFAEDEIFRPIPQAWMAELAMAGKH